MSDGPTAEQLDLLLFISRAGGYVDRVDDMALAEACIDREWLAHEGRTGYALTLDGHSLMRRLSPG